MITQHVRKIIDEAIAQIGGEVPDYSVVYAESGFGDFATNVPFLLSGRLKRPPMDLAAELAAAIRHEDVERAEAAGAGYVNLTMTDAFWGQALQELDRELAPKKGEQKVQVEFISANPTGPLTLGNARGGFLGDVLARVLKHQGFDVTAEYYFNDGGTQVAKLVESVRCAAGLQEVEEVQYRGDYIQELASDYVAQLKGADAAAADTLTTAVFERWIRPAIMRMNVHFDEWFNEKSLIQTGQFDEAIDKLRQLDLVYEKDGALWLASSRYGDERDRVLKKTSGDVTYLGTDIAYHINIFEKRRFDRAIKIWGADHAGQVPSLKLTLERLLPEASLDFVIVQWVRLMQGGKEVKMSKRAGTYVTVDELIEEVGADVARFFFLLRSADSQMDFDLDLAKEESQKNPLWYLMYSYARAHSIMDQAKERGLVAAAKATAEGLPRELIKEMVRLPELIQETAADYRVQRLAHYGMDIAASFHDTYEQERIIGMEKDRAENMLYLIQQYIKHLKTYFELLGITPIEKM